jgi:hypothetical protein
VGARSNLCKGAEVGSTRAAHVAVRQMREVCANGGSNVKAAAVTCEKWQFISDNVLSDSHAFFFQ